MPPKECKKCEDFKLERDLHFAQAQDLSRQLHEAWYELEKHGLNRFVRKTDELRKQDVQRPDGK
jgi:hypothetical protein